MAARRGRERPGAPRQARPAPATNAQGPARPGAPAGGPLERPRRAAARPLPAPRPRGASLGRLPASLTRARVNAAAHGWQHRIPSALGAPPPLFDVLCGPAPPARTDVPKSARRPQRPAAALNGSSHNVSTRACATLPRGAASPCLLHVTWGRRRHLPGATAHSQRNNRPGARALGPCVLGAKWRQDTARERRTSQELPKPPLWPRRLATAAPGAALRAAPARRGACVGAGRNRAGAEAARAGPAVHSQRAAPPLP